MTTEEVTAADAAETTREDKFFGVTTAIEDMVPNKETEVKAEDIVVVSEGDDAPAEDSSKAESKSEDSPEKDIESYSNKVQKRIDKLTWQAKEAERQRIAAEKERNEAFRVAKQLHGQSQQQAQIISTGEARLVKEMTDKAELLVSTAKAKYAKAYEEGNTEAILAAQEEMIRAQAQNQTAQSVNNDYQQRVAAWAQQQQHQQQQHQQRYAPPQQQATPPQQPPVRKPTPEAEQWTKDNPWFGKDEHRDMTAIAYATHQTMIVDKGVQPDSPEYYEELDSTMRNFFPNYFTDDTGAEQPRSSGRPHAVVAPATRNTGAKKRTIKLNASQRSLAKAIGISDEQYALQLLKENNRA